MSNGKKNDVIEKFPLHNTRFCVLDIDYEQYENESFYVSVSRKTKKKKLFISSPLTKIIRSNMNLNQVNNMKRAGILRRTENFPSTI